MEMKEKRWAQSPIFVEIEKKNISPWLDVEIKNIKKHNVLKLTNGLFKSHFLSSCCDLAVVERLE